MIFKNGEEVRILSKIITKDKTIIKNNTFPKFNLQNNEKIKSLINELKITYEDAWKDYNQINTSIKLSLIVRIDNKDSKKLLQFEKVLNKLDLVNYYSINKFNKEHIFYEIIFNGSPVSFINIMKENEYAFDTQKKIWILK